jgi:hypothetical protein
MFLYTAPTCFGPFGPSSGSTHWNLVEVIVSLKYQLKHFVKIVVVEWQMNAFVGKIILYLSKCTVKQQLRFLKQFIN